MFSQQIIAYRRKLRAIINQTFPQRSSEEIFDLLRREANQFILVQDIIPLAERVEIPASRVDDIFIPYHVRNHMISKKQFKTFFEDEFSTSIQVEVAKNEVSDENRMILTAFASAVRSRAPPQPSTRWAFIVSKNSPNAAPSHVRLASLCRLCDEWNLAFTPEQFIDAVFQFLGERVESLDFTQFNEMMRIFS